MSQPDFHPPYFPVSEAKLAKGMRRIMPQLYMWMVLGVCITAFVAFVVSVTALLGVARAPLGFLSNVSIGLLLVIVLMTRLMRLTPHTALLMFFGYTALFGGTLALIFATYTLESIIITAAVTACIFAAMSIIGYSTELDLSTVSGIWILALSISLIGAVANLFTGNIPFHWFLTYTGIAIFVGLTIYATQRVRTLIRERLKTDNQAVVQRAGVMSALLLYLDFAFLFVLLVRIVGAFP